MDLSQKYQKKTDKQHVLDNPDTYIGSVEQVETTNWLFQDDKIKQVTHTYIPGLYKLFDEGIVNCRDHVVRMEQKTPVTYIDISIGDDGTISMTNDGDGIDVEVHPDYGVYVPELIFGHLRTSTNYDKSEKKVVGGKNGFGFKLVLIWSEYGSVETVDAVRKLKYVQTFRNNLDLIDPPKITPCSKKSYTTIKFKPDYKRFGISGLDETMKQLLVRRVYDIAAVTTKTIKVKLNGVVLPLKTFTQYIDLYIGPKEASPRVYETCDRWEYAVAASDEFIQVSFVNGIHTSKGGKHVDYIMNQIIRMLTAYIQSKKKIDVKQSTIRENLMVFINCSVENPSFDSQTKDFLNTPSSKFGSVCEVSDKFIEKIASKAGLGLMDRMVSLTQLKETVAAKKTDGSKTRTIRGIPKLVDANYAGTVKSNQCTLILCEGDSAKAGVVSGLSTDDRNYYGIYPLKGKLLNVRDEVLKKINENKEIMELKQIMGLENGKHYTEQDIKTKLRYGKVLFITDQDLDGSHIKGLGINLFDSLWKSLVQYPGFLGFMNTPIIKAKRGSDEILFYNEIQYNDWKLGNTSGWTTKYYKGLGTSTAVEFKEYFKHKKIVNFDWDEASEDTLDKVFNKKRADDRKAWLENYSRDICVDTNRKSISFNEFVDHELIHFSKYDCDRSIPNMVDGLKISQRKILYAAFKKNNLKTEIKVAQFSGYVSEHSLYHHGEASLNGAIIGMAQNFVGSNNINLLKPNGQFGTRLEGGKDSASERYTFTQLNPLTRFIFPQEDDDVMLYLHDDGFKVEPNYYVPILPMVLVNGCKGIGTGFSTDIMCYNPIEIIDCLKAKLRHEPAKHEFVPFYRGFTGSISKVDNKYVIKGVYTLDELSLTIQELPVGVWTCDYKKFLETLVEEKTIKDFTDNSTDTKVHFNIKLLAPVEDVEKMFKLAVVKSTSNMHLFDASEKLKKYESVEDIIDEFYSKRLATYEERKAFIMTALESQMTKISNKVKYIKGVLSGKLDLRGKKMEAIDDELTAFGLQRLDGSFHYLTKLPMDSVSDENVAKMLKDEQQIRTSLTVLTNQTVEEMWMEDLVKLSKALSWD